MSLNMPPITKNLIIINLLMYLGKVVAQRYGIDFDDLLGLHFFLASDFKLWQLFTYMFIHGGLEHIFFNMFAVWMFGRIMEQVMGSQRFLFYYIMCGLGAGLVQEVVWQFTWTNDFFASIEAGGSQLGAAEAEMLYRSGQLNHLVPQFCNMLITVGASGAVFGLLLAFGMIFPKVPLYILFIPIPIQARYVVLAYGLLELFFGVSGRLSGVAHFAHLGGMIFGIFLILYWKHKGTLLRGNGFY